MSNWIIVILCAVAAVALFVAGMSLTLMLKGHHIDSEISTNKEMQRRGIKCAVQETREAMQQADCSDTSGLCSGSSAENRVMGFRRCGIRLFQDTDAAGSENR